MILEDFVAQFDSFDALSEAAISESDVTDDGIVFSQQIVPEVDDSSEEVVSSYVLVNATSYAEYFEEGSIDNNEDAKRLLRSVRYIGKCLYVFW